MNYIDAIRKTLDAIQEALDPNDPNYELDKRANEEAVNAWIGQRARDEDSRMMWRDAIEFVEAAGDVGVDPKIWFTAMKSIHPDIKSPMLRQIADRFCQKDEHGNYVFRKHVSIDPEQMGMFNSMIDGAKAAEEALKGFGRPVAMDAWIRATATALGGNAAAAEVAVKGFSMAFPSSIARTPEGLVSYREVKPKEVKEGAREDAEWLDKRAPGDSVGPGVRGFAEKLSPEERRKFFSKLLAKQIEKRTRLLGKKRTRR
jgi:hypothetical protein